MALRLYDAHNHLQDERFGGRQDDLLAICAQTGVAAMVVNGSCEADWSQVLALARCAEHRSARGGNALQQAGQCPVLQIIPSFGYHPWYIHERTVDWLRNLAHFLDEVPSAVGEIGLDRWKPGLSYVGQEEVFIAQLRLAAERNLAASIHCLQVWGRLLEIMRTEPRPARGFLLHSYGGPTEMVRPFADLGAYFSLPGFFAHERKARQRATFQHVPTERLLIETDSPDQRLPELRRPEGGGRTADTKHFFGDAKIYPLTASSGGQGLNHPANLAAVYAFAAELRGVTTEALSAQVEQNFLRLFGGR